jgi:hypothetical protein
MGNQNTTTTTTANQVKNDRDFVYLWDDDVKQSPTETTAVVDNDKSNKVQHEDMIGADDSELERLNVMVDDYQKVPTMTNYTSMIAEAMHFSKCDGLKNLRDVLSQKNLNEASQGILGSLLTNPQMIAHFGEDKLHRTLELNIEYWELLRDSKQILQLCLGPLQQNLDHIEIWSEIIREATSTGSILQEDKMFIQRKCKQTLEKWFREDCASISTLTGKWQQFSRTITEERAFWEREYAKLDRRAQQSQQLSGLATTLSAFSIFSGVCKMFSGGLVFLGLIFAVYATYLRYTRSQAGSQTSAMTELQFKTKQILDCMRGMEKNGKKMDQLFTEFDTKNQIHEAFEVDIQQNKRLLLRNLSNLQNAFTNLRKEFQATVIVINNCQNEYIDSLAK